MSATRSRHDTDAERNEKAREAVGTHHLGDANSTPDPWDWDATRIYTPDLARSLGLNLNVLSAGRVHAKHDIKVGQANGDYARVFTVGTPESELEGRHESPGPVNRDLPGKTSHVASLFDKDGLRDAMLAASKSDDFTIMVDPDYENGTATVTVTED